MKKIILILVLGFIGCGGNQTDGLDPAGNALTEGENYTLQTHYTFRLNAQDIILWGVDQAFGHVNEEASTWNSTTSVACGIRLLVTETSPNEYILKIGASNQTGAGCGQFSGDYTMRLTGPTSADIEWATSDDSLF